MRLTADILGATLLVASLASAAASGCGLRRPAIVAIALVAGGAALVPVMGMSAAGYLWAFPGPLSAATLLLLVRWLLWSLGVRGLPVRVSGLFLIAVVGCGLLLYPMAFRLTAFDAYDLGFRGGGVAALMIALVLTGWWIGAHDVAVWVAVAALLFLSGAYDSHNLWDYLVDPVAFTIALVMLVVRAWRLRGQPRAKRENAFTTRS